MECEELRRLSRAHLEALLNDNRAEIRIMIDPQDESSRVAKQETEQALRIAHEDLMAHKEEHGC